jgi:heptosyltransferase-2
VYDRAGAPRRVAVVAPNWLGDAVMSLPALGILAHAHGVSLTVMAGPYTARVFLHQTGVDDLMIDHSAGRMTRIGTRARALRRARPDAAVVFPPSFSSALPPWLARVPRRIGFRSDGRGAWLTRGLPLPSRDIHLAASYRELSRAALESLGLAAPLAPPARLVVTDRERRAIRVRLGEVARDGYVVVVPGAAFGPAKSWPAERYAALCRQLARETRVVLAGSAGDRARCDEVAGSVRDVHTLAGETSLDEFFALIEGARALVANDSGAPHVAAALDIPVVVLFGSTSPAWTAPVGHDVRVLQHKVHCNPCYRRTCPTQLECFNGIAVDEVLAAVREILAKPREKDDAAGAESRIESEDGGPHARPVTHG